MKPLLWRLAENYQGRFPEPKWRIIMDGSASRIRSTRESSEDCARRLHDKRSIAWPNVSSHRYIMLTKEELVAEIAQVENETILLYEPMITLTATLHRPNGESCVVSKQTFKIPKLIL